MATNNRGAGTGLDGGCSFLELGAAGLAAAALVGRTESAPQPQGGAGQDPTRFQIACMTLPYSQFPLQRALTGIRGAGYRYVAWGTTHREEGGKQVPVLAGRRPAGAGAANWPASCRDLGLEPVMMFSVRLSRGQQRSGSARSRGSVRPPRPGCRRC